MDKVLDSAKDVKDEILKLESVKEFFRLKEIFEKDSELARLRKEIARLKAEEKFEEHKNLLEIYNFHPLVCNFENAKQEVIEILNEIKKILN